jgi:hypothetical protein
MSAKPRKQTVSKQDKPSRAEKTSRLPDPASIKFETGVPIPEDLDVRQRIAMPFQDLKVSESFSFPATSTVLRQLQGVKSSLQSHLKHYPDKKFVVRHVQSEGVIRVWRTK